MTVTITSMKFVENALGMQKDLILLAILETDHQNGKPRPDKLIGICMFFTKNYNLGDFWIPVILKIHFSFQDNKDMGDLVKYWPRASIKYKTRRVQKWFYLWQTTFVVCSQGVIKKVKTQKFKDKKNYFQTRELLSKSTR